MEQAWLSSLPILPLFRVLAVATAFPILAGPGAPRNVRLAVSLALSCVLIPFPFHRAQLALDPITTLVAVPLEVLIGLSIGYAFSLLFHALAVAGDFVGQEMGLNAATQIDPISGRPVPLLARLFEMIGLVMFVEFGGLGLMLETVRTSFELLPSGSLTDPGRIAGALASTSLDTISVGIAIALPAGLLLMLLTLFTTIAARVLPKLHIFDFAYAIRMLVAIFLVALLLPRLLPASIRFVHQIHEAVGSALGSR